MRSVNQRHTVKKKKLFHQYIVYFI